jgi:integrase
LVTAQRVGEVCGMGREELDLDKRLWSLPGARTKNGVGHEVPLSDLAIALIREALAAGDSPFVFPDGAGARLPVAVAAQVYHAHRRGRSPLPHFTVHDLRRTALTNMASLGVSPLVLGHVANHLTTTKAGMTLRVYVRHSFLSEKAAALDLWSDRLSAIVTGNTPAKILPLRGT